MDSPRDSRVLWYRTPAEEWNEGLPVGNGRLGGMVYGHADDARVVLNEDSLWAGRDVDRINPAAKEHLSTARELLLNGEHERAESVIQEHLTGDPERFRPYQPLGELRLKPTHNDIEGFRRELDLREGIARTSYETGDASITREVFASNPDDVLVIRYSADEPGAISLTASVDRQRDARSHPRNDHQLVLRGVIVDLPSVAELGGAPGLDDGGWGTRFEACVDVRAEGGDPEPVAAEGDRPAGIRVEDADAVTIRVAAATDFRVDDPTAASRSAIDAAPEAYQPLREAHIDDHRSLFDRVSMSLGDSVAEPTDERINALSDGARSLSDDPDLAALAFQYGRYLLIASSRPGSLPANLQGLWNRSLNPPWNCDYHLDINLQMNYWPAEVGNLPETVEPLVDYIEGFERPGGQVATEHYDCDGWVAHQQSNHWNTATPAWRNGVWVTGGAWLCQHLYERYRYGRDDEYLEERAYPIMRGAAEFLLDFLIEDDGELVTVPSISPENRFHAPDGSEAIYCVGSMLDVQLCRELFTNCIEAAEHLGTDRVFRETLAEARDRLPELQIGQHGQLQEWREDYEEVDPGHRHISHLYGLHPGEQITLRESPELAEAVRTSLERRIAHVPESPNEIPGWGRAWYTAQFARLEAGERAVEQLHTQLAENTLPNLFSDVLQVDGAFGATAGIAEMLLGSHAGELRFLPAVPNAWPSGSVSGLRARGGFEVDMEWSNGTLDNARISSDGGGTCRVRTYGVRLDTIEGSGYATVTKEQVDENVVSLDIDAGDEVRLRAE